MYEQLHPEQQLQLVRQHHADLRRAAVSARAGRERRRFRGERGSLRLRLRPRQRVRRVASASGLTRTAGVGAASPH